MTELKRFKRCSRKVKLHLYKALTKTILEYPAVPLDQSLIQGIRNNTFGWALGLTFPDTTTSEQMYILHNIEPVNTSTHRLSRNV